MGILSAINAMIKVNERSAPELNNREEEGLRNFYSRPLIQKKKNLSPHDVCYPVDPRPKNQG